MASAGSEVRVICLRAKPENVGLLIFPSRKQASNSLLADFVSKLILEINVPETQRADSFMRNSGRLVEAAGAAFKQRQSLSESKLAAGSLTLRTLRRLLGFDEQADALHDSPKGVIPMTLGRESHRFSNQRPLGALTSVVDSRGASSIACGSSRTSQDAVRWAS